jgi:hypothetical protein
MSQVGPQVPMLQTHGAQSSKVCPTYKALEYSEYLLYRVLTKRGKKYTYNVCM